LKQPTTIELYGVAHRVPVGSLAVHRPRVGLPKDSRAMYADVEMYPWSASSRKRDDYLFLFVRTTSTSTPVSKGSSGWTGVATCSTFIKCKICRVTLNHQSFN